MIATLFDTETTGLITNRTLRLSEQPSVIEFHAASVDLKKGKVLKEWGTLVNPPRNKQVLDAYNPDKMKKGKTIEHMTGISLSMLDDAPTIEEVFPQIKKFLEESKACSAHNLRFDREMIDIEAERLKEIIKWPKIMICTIEQTMTMKGYRLNLTAIHELLFGEKFDEAHRAKPDVHAQARVAIELYKRGML